MVGSTLGLIWILYCFHVFVFGLTIVVAAKSVVISEPLSENLTTPSADPYVSRNCLLRFWCRALLLFAISCPCVHGVSRLVFEVNVDYSIYSGKARIIISKNKFSSFSYIFENNTLGIPPHTLSQTELPPSITNARSLWIKLHA